MRWYEQVAAMAFPTIATDVGLSKRGARWGPCPACQADRTSGSDGRAPVGFNDKGWHCHACDTGGDSADLFAHAIGGARVRNLTSDGKDQVKEEAVRRGFASPDDGQVYRPNKPAKRPNKPSEGTGKRKRVAFRIGDEGAISSVEAKITRHEYAFDFDPELQARAERELYDNPDAAGVLDYLHNRGFSDETIAAWHLGAFFAGLPEKPARWWVVIPLWDPQGNVVNYKFRGVPSDPEDIPKPKYLTCRGRPNPLFGARALSKNLSDPVLICEGELDVVALWQYGIENAVSGTLGDSWDEEWLDTLEAYTSFVLLQDTDEVGEGVVLKVAESLGRERCARARLPKPHKDAGDCLRAGVTREEVDVAIDNAEPLVSLRIVRPSFFRGRIEEGIVNPEQSWKRRGRPTGSTVLDELLGGWPPGVIGVTGPSGTGKTSFVDWAAYMQALLGVPVLVTSFENGSEQVSDDLLRMELGGDPMSFTATDRVVAWSAVDGMPVHVVNHEGFTPPEELLQSFRFAARRMKIRFYILDHLGYTINYSDRRSEVQQLDATTKMFSAFARDTGSTVLLVAHPDKQHRSKDRRVYFGDAKGSTSIEQECAGGLTLEIPADLPENSPPMTRIHVDKWRPKYGLGAGASASMYYDPVSNLYGGAWQDLPSGFDDHEPGR